MVMEAAGFNPVNRRALSAFAALGEGNIPESMAGVESIGVVSAASDAEDIAEIVSALRLPRVIVTGLDCTLRLGATVAAITGGARLAHVTYGPRPMMRWKHWRPRLWRNCCWIRHAGFGPAFLLSKAN